MSKNLNDFSSASQMLEHIKKHTAGAHDWSEENALNAAAEQGHAVLLSSYRGASTSSEYSRSPRLRPKRESFVDQLRDTQNEWRRQPRVEYEGRRKKPPPLYGIAGCVPTYPPGDSRGLHSGPRFHASLLPPGPLSIVSPSCETPHRTNAGWRQSWRNMQISYADTTSPRGLPKHGLGALRGRAGAEAMRIPPYQRPS